MVGDFWLSIIKCRDGELAVSLEIDISCCNVIRPLGYFSNSGTWVTKNLRRFGHRSLNLLLDFVPCQFSPKGKPEVDSNWCTRSVRFGISSPDLALLQGVHFPSGASKF
jgi:hypothetical protein